MGLITLIHVFNKKSHLNFTLYLKNDSVSFVARQCFAPKKKSGRGGSITLIVKTEHAKGFARVYCKTARLYLQGLFL